MNIEDDFDNINNFQQEIFNKGFNNGKIEKNNVNKIESYTEGFNTGKDIGSELGYYAGIIENIKEFFFIMQLSDNKKEKIEKKLFDIQNLIINFDCNLEFQEIQNILLKIRAGMKILFNLCNIKF